MADKRLLYFTSRQVSAFRWQGGKLEAEAVFAKDDADALPSFSNYVAAEKKALYLVLLDVVDEDFHQETIPYVRGKDRRILLGRKLAQRYRDLSLTLSMSLGYESGPRKEEKILFGSFTNTQQFQPWLTVLQNNEARLVGVYSVPLVTPQFGKRVGLEDKRYLLVSRQKAGMRQTFVEDGKMRFSRLGQIEGDNMAERAAKVAAEAIRIQQFLLNTRLLTRDSGALKVVVVTPTEHRSSFAAACIDTAQVKFVLLDSAEAARKTGLRSAPEGMLSEPLFLQTLATALPPEQFADDKLRRFYQLWRTRVSLLAAGAAAFVFCALLSALRLTDMINVRQLAEIDAVQERSLSDQYARQQAQFPKTPASPENLKTLVSNYKVLERQTPSIEGMFSEVSRALESAPQIELEKLDWKVGVARRSAPPLQPGGTPAAAAPAARPGDEKDYQEVEIAGRVNVVQASDYRNITLVVNQFVDALRKQPGIEIVSTRLPFDLNAEKSLSGDIGAERAQEIPRFTVVAVKRLGT